MTGIPASASDFISLLMTRQFWRSCRSLAQNFTFQLKQTVAWSTRKPLRLPTA